MDPKEMIRLFQSFLCLFGMHKWGRWTYFDWQDRTEVTRECQGCRKRKDKIAEGNDLF